MEMDFVEKLLLWPFNIKIPKIVLPFKFVAILKPYLQQN